MRIYVSIIIAGEDEQMQKKQAVLMIIVTRTGCGAEQRR